MVNNSRECGKVSLAVSGECVESRVCRNYVTATQHQRNTLFYLDLETIINLRDNV